ncbi:MAG: hypothetical protein ACRCZF_14445 [Gemmataceae bacterium]
MMNDPPLRARYEFLRTESHTMPYTPTLEPFLALAAAHPAALVPITRTLVGDTLTPVSAFARLQAGPPRRFLVRERRGGRACRPL